MSKKPSKKRDHLHWRVWGERGLPLVISPREGAEDISRMASSRRLCRKSGKERRESQRKQGSSCRERRSRKNLFASRLAQRVFFFFFTFSSSFSFPPRLGRGDQARERALFLSSRRRGGGRGGIERELRRFLVALSLTQHLENGKKKTLNRSSLDKQQQKQKTGARHRRGRPQAPQGGRHQHHRGPGPRDQEGALPHQGHLRGQGGQDAAGR